MIIIKIDCQGVQGIEFDCSASEGIEDYHLVVLWPTIRRFVDAMDAEIKHYFERFQTCLEQEEAKTDTSRNAKGEKREGDGDGK